MICIYLTIKSMHMKMTVIWVFQLTLRWLGKNIRERGRNREKESKYGKMFKTVESGQSVHRNSLYYSCNFSVSLKLFQNKKLTFFINNIQLKIKSIKNNSNWIEVKSVHVKMC